MQRSGSNGGHLKQRRQERGTAALAALLCVLVAAVAFIVVLRAFDARAQDSDAETQSQPVGAVLEARVYAPPAVVREPSIIPLPVEETPEEEPPAPLEEEIQEAPAVEPEEAVQETEPEMDAPEPSEEPEPVSPYPTDEISLSYDLQLEAQAAAEKYGVPLDLLLSVMFHESSFNPGATNGTCWGLMQIHNMNFSWLEGLLADDGVCDIQYDPVSNIRAGAYLLGVLYEKYGDWNKALMCYNCGEGTAMELWAQGCYST